jgi:hypothetical protein
MAIIYHLLDRTTANSETDVVYSVFTVQETPSGRCSSTKINFTHSNPETFASVAQVQIGRY